MLGNARAFDLVYRVLQANTEKLDLWMGISGEKMTFFVNRDSRIIDAKVVVR